MKFLLAALAASFVCAEVDAGRWNWNYRSQTRTVQRSYVCQSGVCNVAPVLAVQSAAIITGSAEQVLEMVNAHRIKAGLHALVLDSQLVKGAMAHSNWQHSRKRVRHSRWVGRENVAGGQRSATVVMREWMRSSGHRANIMHRSVTRIGIGRSGSYWTMRLQ